ncbi:MAG TPA: aldo/keto reductase [Thermoanaerobaculia bacterium]|jgi:diketogulonate reductase-like aldo/keto reductase
MPKITRRELAVPFVAAGAALVLRSSRSVAASTPILTRPIPSSGERLPVIGIGSWITFNVGDDVTLRDSCAEVLRAFFREGGRLVDSSPMYGSSQAVIGYALKRLGREAAPFSADKVWTSSDGPTQIEESRKAWGIPRFDLLQVHNLLDWEEHLPTLFAMKAAGKLRYVGITTSEGRRHAEIESVMRRHPIDFVQVTYNAVDRAAEERILPLAQERKIAVITNRPFQQGTLIDRVARKPLPAWAREIDCANWAQVLLKFIVSHPAVTCAIPATSRVDHVKENVGAAFGRMPDAAMRQRIAQHVAAL